MSAQPKEADVKKQESASSTSSTGGSASGSAEGSKQAQEGEKPRQADGPLLVKRGATGVVDFFNQRSGYGFIQVDDSDERVFVHCNSVLTFVPSYTAKVERGDKVEFDIMHGLKGKEAVAVTGIGGYRIGTRRFFNNSRPGTMGPRRGGGNVIVVGNSSSGRRPRGERQPRAEEKQSDEVVDKMKELSVAGDDEKGEEQKEDKPKGGAGKRRRRPKKSTKADDPAGEKDKKE